MTLSITTIENIDFTGATNPSGFHTGASHSVAANTLNLLFVRAMSDVTVPSDFGVSSTMFAWRRLPLMTIATDTRQSNGSVRDHHQRVQVFYAWASTARTGTTTVNFGTLNFGSSPSTSADREAGWQHIQVSGFLAPETVENGGAFLIRQQTTGSGSGASTTIGGVPMAELVLDPLDSAESLGVIFGIEDNGANSPPVDYSTLTYLGGEQAVGNISRGQTTLHTVLTNDTGPLGGPFTNWSLGAFEIIQQQLELPPIECIRHAFGYNSTADLGFAYLGTNDETGGYSRAGGGLSVYPVGPLTEVSSIDGALIIATVHRFAWDSSTPPPRGTLSGFGATWDLIDYQEAVGNDGAAFVEIYRTMQLDYGPFPDYEYPGEPPNEGIGYLEYTFPPNDRRYFTSVGWMSYKGADAAGYADNGASAIRNFTTYPITTETSARTFTHTAPTRDTNSILWFSAWDLLWGGVEGTSPSGNWSAISLAEASQILDITPFFDDYYGSGGVHYVPPPAFSSDPVREWASGGSVLQFPSFTNTWHYSWPPGDVYVIWGKSLEILIDPNVLCPEELPAYWGILVVPA